MRQKLLPKVAKPETGPRGRNSMREAEPDPLEVPLDAPDFDRQDFSILDRVRGCLIKKSPFSEPILALEILDGPYRGIVFEVTTFTMMTSKIENGMVPTRYETVVHRIPPALKQTFVKDEAFDHFTSEIVVAWMGYIHTNDLAPLIKMKPTGSVQ